MTYIITEVDWKGFGPYFSVNQPIFPTLTFQHKLTNFNVFSIIFVTLPTFYKKYNSETFFMLITKQMFNTSICLNQYHYVAVKAVWLIKAN